MDLDLRRLTARLREYRTPSLRRSLTQLAITAAGFAATWALMWAAAAQAYWLSLLLAPLAAALLVRLFVIQHDCGHGSYFHARQTNDWVGRALGVVTLTPYDYWRGAHATHHASSGNLDRRGVGDITTLTLAEYRDLGPWRRLAYRLYRHPLILFGVGPTYLFLVQHRWPPDRQAGTAWLRTSLMATNLAILAAFLGLALLVGPLTLLKLQLPVVLLASSLGVWLFYVQHQFERAHWARDGEWVHARAALHGSSYYALPGALRWLTADIGLHHIHHMCSRVPNYRLRECLDALPELREVGRLGIWQSLRTIRLTLWDEDAGRLISFRDARRRAS